MCFKQNTSSESLHLQSRRPERLGSRWPPGGNIEGVTQWTGVSTAWPRKTLWFTTGPNIFTLLVFFSSVQFSHSVVSDSLWPHESQHARPPCPSPTPKFTQTHVHQVSDAIQPSHPVVPFSSCPQTFPVSGSFPMSQLFTWGSQSIGVSASISVLPMNTQDWSLLGWSGWTSLQSKGLSRVFSNTIVQKHQFFSTQLSSQSYLTSIHDHWKNHSLD